MKARLAASAALAIVLALGASGCAMLTYQATTEKYDASDGVSADIGDLDLRNILLVSEDALEQAVLLMLEIEKSVTEGAGAAGLAAVIANRERFKGKRVGIVISGGNVDARLLSAILLRGLVRSGRLVRLRVDISDQPGLLGRVANLIGAAGGNIVEVYHQRLFHDVPLKMAELDVVIETRDARHIDEILAALRAAGLPANLLSSVTGEEIR